MSVHSLTVRCAHWARSVRLLVIALIAGCSDTSSEPPGGGNQPPPSPPRYTVSGIVQDSAAGRALAGIIVAIANTRDTTDFLGSYSVQVDSGQRVVSVTAPAYEDFSLSRSFTSNTTFNIPLRRLAPLVKDFVSASGSSQVAATILDLQGATTIDRGNGSSLFYEGPGFGFLAFAGPWSWTQLDGVSWRVTVNLDRTNSTLFTWSIVDANGNRARFACPVGGSCQEQ